MARRQDDELCAPSVEERVGSDDQTASPPFNNNCVRRLELVLCISGHHYQAAAQRIRRLVHRLHNGFGVGVTWVHETATAADLGVSSCINSSFFGSSMAPKKLIPVALSPGLLRLATSPDCTGSRFVVNTIGIVGVVAFAVFAT